MRRMTGLETDSEIPSKVLQMYKAVEELLLEGADMNDICVSAITRKAGIGKGTAYDYFDTKEEILACAILFYIKKAMEELSGALEKYDSFAKQIGFLLDEIAAKGCKHQCILHYIHMMTDSSALSRLVRQKMQDEEAEAHLLHGVFAQMLQKGREKGQVRHDLPLDYMVYLLFSKIFTYILWIYGRKCQESGEDEIRIWVQRGILDELCVTEALGNDED